MTVQDDMDFLNFLHKNELDAKDAVIADKDAEIARLKADAKAKVADAKAEAADAKAEAADAKARAVNAEAEASVRFSKLANILYGLGRGDECLRAGTDADYREKLFKEFAIV